MRAAMLGGLITMGMFLGACMTTVESEPAPEEEAAGSDLIDFEVTPDVGPIHEASSCTNMVSNGCCDCEPQVQCDCCPNILGQCQNCNCRQTNQCRVTTCTCGPKDCVGEIIQMADIRPW